MERLISDFNAVMNFSWWTIAIIYFSVSIFIVFIQAILFYVFWRLLFREKAIKEFISRFQWKDIPFVPEYWPGRSAGSYLSELSENASMSPHVRANCAYLLGELAVLTNPAIVGFWQALRIGWAADDALDRYLKTQRRRGVPAA